MPTAPDGGWSTPCAEKWLQYRRHLSTADARRNASQALIVEEGVKKQIPTPSAAQKKEASQRYRRPHILHVELGELILNAADLGLELAWYETARYFVSLHPSSVRLPTVQWPTEAPHPKPHAKYMASTPQACSTAKSDVYGQQELVQMNEKLEMQVDGLDSHFVLFLWCQRSSLLGETTVLLGYRPIPLRDVTLYSRWAAWDISDLEASQELAQLSLRLNVTAPPAQIRLAHLSGVSEDGFTLNWSEPIGSPATAYAVSVHVPGTAVALSRQMTSAHEVSLYGLLPGKIYLVGITGMNQAGWGEALELEASTRAPRLEQEEEDDEPVHGQASAAQLNRPGVTRL